MFQRKNAAFLPVYLYWPISGVTLAEEQMVPGQRSITMCDERRNLMLSIGRVSRSGTKSAVRTHVTVRTGRGRIHPLC